MNYLTTEEPQGLRGRLVRCLRRPDSFMQLPPVYDLIAVKR
jgi:hypothetical protein